MPIIAIAFVLAATLGGGTAAMAQNAMPNDMLWDFKVYVNEGLRGALSNTNEAKANWDITAIETRLAEAAKLAAEGELSTHARTSIQNNIEAHANGVADAVAKLQAEGNTTAAANVASRYQATLAAQVDSPLTATVLTTLDVASQLSASANAAAAVTAGVQASF